MTVINNQFATPGLQSTTVIEMRQTGYKTKVIANLPMVRLKKIDTAHLFFRKVEIKRTQENNRSKNKFSLKLASVRNQTVLNL